MSVVSSPTEALVVPAPPLKRTAKLRAATPILTIEAHTEAETQESIEDTIWHEIHNAYCTRRMLTGTLDGIEQTDNGKTLVIVEYKGFRVIIPMKEMMINLGCSPSGDEYEELMRRQNKILGNMLGPEIDFMVKGIDSKTRSVVVSRQESMLKKRQVFYMNTDAAGMYRIYDGRVVQARVIAVAEKVVRVEVFGVECSILARDLAWDWIGDAHERFSVGDQILVRILSVKRESLENISITADAKSVSEDQTHENLKKCRVQSKYSGKVTDVRRGVVYVRLQSGVNGVAHSCYDRRIPGKKDDVSFAVTRIDEESGNNLWSDRGNYNADWLGLTDYTNTTEFTITDCYTRLDLTGVKDKEAVQYVNLFGLLQTSTEQETSVSNNIFDNHDYLATESEIESPSEGYLGEKLSTLALAGDLDNTADINLSQNWSILKNILTVGEKAHLLDYVQCAEKTAIPHGILQRTSLYCPPIHLQRQHRPIPSPICPVSRVTLHRRNTAVYMLAM